MQLTHSLKAPGFNPCAYTVKTRFQSLLSYSTCTATCRARGPWSGNTELYFTGTHLFPSEYLRQGLALVHCMRLN
jgi:hypothetical protein